MLILYTLALISSAAIISIHLIRLWRCITAPPADDLATLMQYNDYSKSGNP